MMATRRYTREQLINLRSSPLVQKPENLPAIEQWIDESQQQSQQNAGGARRQAQSKVGGEASPMGAFSAGVRPGLVTRTTGSKGEDISLGPPRTMFPSSRNTPKVTDAADKLAAGSGDANNGEEQDIMRSRFGDRANRKSGTEKEGKDTRESWTAARERRALAGEDDSKYERHARKDREYDGDRRTGQGDKSDSRWGERRPNTWRERQRERERGHDRVGGVVEKDPEWMDDPAPAGGDDDLGAMGMPRNQEQFQKWKEAMSGKKAQTAALEQAEVEPVMPSKDTTTMTAKTIATLKLEGIVDKPFGGWNDSKAPASLTDTTSKPAPTKSRASRFASMFKDVQPKEEVSPPPDTVPSPGPVRTNGSAEDVAGFNRILQMLGGTNVSTPPAQEIPTSPTRATSSGDKQKSRFTSFFDQTPKSPDGAQSPPPKSVPATNGNNSQANRGLMEDATNTFGGMLPDAQHAEHVRQGKMISPQPPMNGNRGHAGQHTRPNDVFLNQQQQPPSREAATPDINIQNLLASQRAQKPQGQDKNSQFLLNLLQEKGTRPPSQQQRSDSFPLWLDQPPNMGPEPHAPKPRGAPPPPGFIDDQLLRNAPPDPPRQDQQPLAERRQSQRAPPGFFDESHVFLQQHQQPRRTFAEPPQQHQQPGHARRPSGHPTNMPPMPPPPPHQHFGGGPPPDFMQGLQGSLGGGQGPPPGFNQPMPRHPPGFHNFPNVFQQPQQQGHQRSDMPPGGFPGGMPGGPAPTMASPPLNAPPGFYGAPPGMPPPPGFMGMRSPNEGIQAGGLGLRDAGRGYDGARFDAAAHRR